MTHELTDELFEWLRIPSISTGGGDDAALRQAAEWVCDRVDAAGGKAELAGRAEGNPIAVGELAAARPGAPTVLIYGHYDVQGVEPLEDWTTPPFEPAIRDGRIYARGASDDKGNFLPLLHVACALARDGELPVNIRVVVEGEEESGGATIAEWFDNDERGADAAIVYDSGMVDEQLPAITTSVRGVIAFEVSVRVAPRDLHSGVYGGSVLNAVHVLQGMLAAILPGTDGKLRPELRAGRAEPTETELAAWSKLPSGDDVISESGGVPLHPGAGHEYYEHNGADASVDVNGVVGGDPNNARTIVPATAHAKLSMRLAPGQRVEEMREVVESLLVSSAPAGADVDVHYTSGGSPALFDVDSPPLRAGVEALKKTTGMEVALVRSGGSIPILARFADRGIQTIVGGFSLPDDMIHAPDESYRVESLELGRRSAYDLYAALAALPPG